MNTAEDRMSAAILTVIAFALALGVVASFAVMALVSIFATMPWWVWLVGPILAAAVIVVAIATRET